jgi:hypothetical protein
MTSSRPPIASTYSSSTCSVMFCERSIAATRGWLTPMRLASSRYDRPACSRSAVNPAASRSSSSIAATRPAAPGELKTLFSQSSRLISLTCSSIFPAAQ